MVFLKYLFLQVELHEASPSLGRVVANTQNAEPIIEDNMDKSSVSDSKIKLPSSQRELIGEPIEIARGDWPNRSSRSNFIFPLLLSIIAYLHSLK